MKFIPNAVSTRVARQVLVTQKHSPTILFVGGVVGVVASTVLACRATLKIDEVLDETEKKAHLAKTLKHPDYSEEDRKRDLAILKVRSAASIGKLYAPAIVVGALSIAALTGSHNILSRRNAAITAAYATIQRGFDDYRKRVIGELGEDKDREFLYETEKREIVEESDKGHQVKTVTRVGPNGASRYARFFDEYSSSWNKTPEYNRIFLQMQQNYANDMLHARGHLFLNEVYDKLGLPRSKEGSVVGWVVKNGDNYVDFGIFNDPDRSEVRDFVNGAEGSILLDFNVDGVIYDLI